METVFFDMDGTVVYSQPVAIQAVKKGLRAFYDKFDRSPQIPSDDEITSLIGLPSNEYYKALLPDHLEDQSETLHRFVANTEVNLIQQGEMNLYEGMEPILNTLQQEMKFGMGLVTNGGRNYFNSIREQLNLDRFFARLHCIDDSPTGRKADLVKKLLEKLDDPTSAVIGDKKYDLKAAHENGLPFIGVTWGYAQEGELDNADLLVDTPDQIPDAIDDLN